MTDFYCAAPWRGLHINPNGDVKTCCAGDPNMLGNLNFMNIESILGGPKLKEIRNTIKQGKPHAYCYNCVKAERYGRSERHWHNSVSPEFDAKGASDDDYCPVLIDVRWNTTCNLSCNYCGPACSSKWAGLKKISFRSGVRPYFQKVYEYLQHHSDGIREVGLVGGEPLLLMENEHLLDIVPDHAVITLITNGTVDLASNPIWKKLQARNKVGWSVSFDNIAAQFEYVRHGSTWDQLLHNLDQIQALMNTNQHWGGIHAVYSVYNATALREFTEFARDRRLAINWQNLYQPACLDPMRLGQEIFELAQREIQSLLADPDLCLPAERAFFENVSQQNSSDDLRQELRCHIDDIENRYHQDKKDQFRELWPELAECLK